jgi:hypothetical protein
VPMGKRGHKSNPRAAALQQRSSLECRAACWRRSSPALRPSHHEMEGLHQVSPPQGGGLRRDGLPGHDRSWEESCAVGAPPLSRLLGTRTGRVPPLGVVTTRERPPLGWLPRGMDTAGRSRVPSGTHAEREVSRAGRLLKSDPPQGTTAALLQIVYVVVYPSLIPPQGTTAHNLEKSRQQKEMTL